MTHTPAAAPMASIVIPLFNKVEFTQLCLEALIAATPPELFEVVLVDNASTDGTKALLAQLEGDVTVITNEVNRGFAIACNQGARAAKGKYVVLLNNDTVPQPGWLEALIEEAESDPAIAVVGSKLLFPQTGLIQHAGMAFNDEMGPFHVHLNAPADAPEVNVARDLDAVTGACMLIRRDAYERVGGLDEGYVNSYEDVDLCLKLRMAGYRVRYTPKSMLFHYEGVSEGRGDHNRPNRIRFESRWEPFFKIGRFKSIAQLGGAMASPAIVPPAGEPLVSIVVPVYNKVDYTQLCLQALAAHTPSGWYELLIVDNASSDGTKEFLAQLEGDVTVVHNETNRGFARACNQMAAMARGKYIVLLNNDTVPQPGWLEALVAEVEADPNTGVVGCKLLYPQTGNLQHCGMIMGPQQYPEHFFRHQPATLPQANQRWELDMVTGACMLIRRDLFERLNGFDEGYVNGFEDVDLCVRARMLGYKVRYTPHSVLFHFEGTSEGRFDREADNFRRFHGRWNAAFAGNQLLQGLPIVPETRPDAAPASAVPVRWEGAQFSYHSFAHVNRELCRRLLASGQVALSARVNEAPAYLPEADSPWRPLAERVNRPLTKPAAVHVRHQWPPDFNPPAEGAWVMVQPWEYGGLPDEWVAGMREHVDEMWVYTEWLRDCYIKSGLPPERVHVVPLGVDGDRYRPEGPRYPLQTTKRFKFLFLGGTIPRKGVDALVDAYMSTFTADDDVCLVIKGIGSETFYRNSPITEMLKTLMAKAKDDPRMPAIEYLDASLTDEQVASVYRACDVLVHPYRGEGFGLPIAEAMATGLPVIVTGAGACLDFCDDETAFLIPATEAPLPQGDLGPSAAGYWWAEPDRNALAALMQRVAADPAAARAVGERGRRRILERFSWDHAAARALARIEAIAQRVPRRLGGAAPLALQGVRGKALLLLPNWAESGWQEALGAYVRAFGPQDDVTLAIWLDPAQGVSEAEAAERIMAVVAAAGVEATPDMLLVPDALEGAGLTGLSYAVEALALAPGAQAPAWASHLPAFTASTPEQWRQALGRPQPALVSQP